MQSVPRSLVFGGGVGDRTNGIALMACKDQCYARGRYAANDKFARPIRVRALEQFPGRGKCAARSYDWPP